MATQSKTKTLREQLEAKLKEESIPASYAKMAKLENEEDVDTQLEEIRGVYTETKQELANQGFAQGAGAPPGGGSAGILGKKTGKEADEIKAWAEQNNKQAQRNQAAPVKV